MDIANLEAFVAVVEHGGFTRAASALHLSQPALSRRIGLLEHTLRQPVFERGRLGTRLTDAGRIFLSHAEAALACLRDGAAAVRELEQGQTGDLGLAIVGTLASTGVAAQLGRFRDTHPGVRVLLRTGGSAEVSSLVRRGDVVLGLRYFADAAPDIVSRTLYRESLVVVAAADHRLTRLRRLAPDRLRSESWVAFSQRRGATADPFGQVIRRSLATAGLDDADVVAIDSLTAQKRLVEAGFGLALMPASSVVEELERRTLRTLDVPALRGAVDVTLIHRKGAFLGAAARQLVAALEHEPETVTPSAGTAASSAPRSPSTAPPDRRRARATPAPPRRRR
ncbi:MAG TPA: LysR family transcriptional regulator [Candidatus Binatia bacterium]|nr:LysR family transcriptional regulator [Candidatus Binatia bacterium]